jgi:hypothetical protein
MGKAVTGSDDTAGAWVEPRRHQLRHGKETKVLKELAALKPGRGAAGKIIQREQNYFASHQRRMHYEQIAERGWPIGSGAVESACRQKQCRFKRPGQFWTRAGLRNLCALDEARRNHHWEQLWPAPIMGGDLGSSSETTMNHERKEADENRTSFGQAVAGNRTGS